VLKLINTQDEIDLIRDRNIYQTIKYYESLSESEWNPIDFLPNHTNSLIFETSFLDICFTLAEKNIDTLYNLWEVREMLWVYDKYSRFLAHYYRPPKGN
jgi:hypothetical protein